ncbi:MAG: hypothetical protein II661_04110, partial [Bacteroidales bacterium]|nr:hypothetical protein [Bacteroidales bacterium]
VLEGGTAQQHHLTGITPALPHPSFARCPVVVRSLSSCCPVNDWTTTGQQLDNNRTTTEGCLVTYW